MAKNPLVSVIVPNYKHARFLPQRLSSIFNQTMEDFEVILLDDASPDNSVEILESYASHPKVSALRINEKNSGSVSKQWNLGVSLAKGDYVWIAESDDYADPQFLAEMTAAIAQDQNIAIAFCISNLVDDEGIIKGLCRKWYDDYDWGQSFTKDGTWALQRYFHSSNPIPNVSGALIRKSAFLNAGSADDSFKLSGDRDLYIRILSTTKLAYVAKTLNNFRRHAASVTFVDSERIRVNENLRSLSKVIQALKDSGNSPSELANVKNRGLRNLRNRFADVRDVLHLDTYRHLIEISKIAWPIDRFFGLKTLFTCIVVKFKKTARRIPRIPQKIRSLIKGKN